MKLVENKLFGMKYMDIQRLDDGNIEAIFTYPNIDLPLLDMLKDNDIPNWYALKTFYEKLVKDNLRRGMEIDYDSVFFIVYIWDNEVWENLTDTIFEKIGCKKEQVKIVATSENYKKYYFKINELLYDEN